MITPIIGKRTAHLPHPLPASCFSTHIRYPRGAPTDSLWGGLRPLRPWVGTCAQFTVAQERRGCRRRAKVWTGWRTGTRACEPCRPTAASWLPLPSECLLWSGEARARVACVGASRTVRCVPSRVQDACSVASTLIRSAVSNESGAGLNHYFWSKPRTLV